MRVTSVAVAIAAMLGSSTWVGAEDRVALAVEVGQTVSREVGFAMGHLCDDKSIVRAEMKNGTPENNLFVVTGIQPGTTLCRVGVVLSRPTILFEITVIARKRPR